MLVRVQQPPRQLSFSLRIHVTKSLEATGILFGNNPMPPAAVGGSEEEGRPVSNVKALSRGSIGGVDYEIGRPDLAKIYQKFFPSDTEVSGIKIYMAWSR